jgi:hypothetical protein
MARMFQRLATPRAVQEPPQAVAQSVSHGQLHHRPAWTRILPWNRRRTLEVGHPCHLEPKGLPQHVTATLVRLVLPGWLMKLHLQ